MVRKITKIILVVLVIVFSLSFVTSCKKKTDKSEPDATGASKAPISSETSVPGATAAPDENKTYTDDNPSDIDKNRDPDNPANANDNTDYSFGALAEKEKVPEEQKKKATTDELLTMYMGYSFLEDISFEEDPAAVYSKWAGSDVGCVKELLSRADVVGKAIKLYKDVLKDEPKEHIGLSNDVEGNIKKETKIDWVELLLVQTGFKDKATADEKAEILSLAKQRDDAVLVNGYGMTDELPDLAAAYK